MLISRASKLKDQEIDMWMSPRNKEGIREIADNTDNAIAEAALRFYADYHNQVRRLEALAEANLEFFGIVGGHRKLVKVADFVEAQIEGQ